MLPLLQFRRCHVRDTTCWEITINFETSLTGEVSFIALHIQKKCPPTETGGIFYLFLRKLAIIQVVIEAFICKESFMVSLFDDLTVF